MNKINRKYNCGDFKVGDKVRCIDNEDGYVKLIIGKVYTIKGIINNFVYLPEGGFLPERFIPVTTDNPLNRILYPELKPDGEGYLL